MKEKQACPPCFRHFTEEAKSLGLTRSGDENPGDEQNVPPMPGMDDMICVVRRTGPEVPMPTPRGGVS